MVTQGEYNMRASKTFAKKIKENREEIIDAVYEQYKAHWKGTQQMRYYVYLDHNTGKPSSYEHYGNELLPENVWNGTDLLIAEYTANGTSPEEEEKDSQYLQSTIEYMTEEQLEQFEMWKATEEYKENIKEIEESPSAHIYGDIDIEEYQMKWIKEHTDAYERYCDDIINNQWNEYELSSVEKTLDELISCLEAENEKDNSERCIHGE